MAAPSNPPAAHLDSSEIQPADGSMGSEDGEHGRDTQYTQYSRHYENGGYAQQDQHQHHHQQHQHYHTDSTDNHHDSSIVYANQHHPSNSSSNSDSDEHERDNDHDRGDDDEDDDDMDDEEDPDESSELELPDAEEDIDYDVVYALHTFLATVEGQASVVKGDQLTLLDDSNSYWWLVRVLKTQLVGYIPAENIETPEERLARFYKKQNLNQARARETDIAHGAASARRARAHFRQPHHPTNKMLQEAMRRPKMQLNPELPGGGRFVDFGPPSFQEFGGHLYSDEESEGSMEEGEEGESRGDFEDEEEEGSDGSFEGGSLEDDGHTHARAHGHHQGFAGDQNMHAQQQQHHHAMDDQTQRYYIQQTTEGTVPYESTYDSAEGYDQEPEFDANGQVLPPVNRAIQAKAQAALGVANGARPAYFAPGSESIGPTQQQASFGNLPVDESMRAEQQNVHFAEQQAPQGVISSYSGGSAIERERTPPGATGTASRLKAFTEHAGSSSPTASQDSETKKISLTPRIAREDSTDSNLSEASAPAPASSSHLQPQQQRQPLRNVSNASSTNADVSNVSSTFSGGPMGRNTPTGSEDAEDRSHFRRGSGASSVNSAMSASSAQKRGASPASDVSASGSSSKKKKSGGILGGLFSRNKKDKKDKKEDKDNKGAQRKNSESTSDDDRGSLTNSPAPESPEQEKVRNGSSSGPVTQHLQQRRAQQQAKEEMFGPEAARRQQQVEAQNVMFQAYGIHPRAPGDTSNSSTFAATVTPPANASPAHALVSGNDAGLRQQLAPQTHMAISPSQASMQSNSSSGQGPTGRQLRPGSLIGSPHMANSGGSGEVPVLNVLRVFAGDNIIADATFKTVLLNETTSTEELVKQAMQRFRLDPPVAPNETITPMDAIMQEYYLTAKEVDGEETRFLPGQKPLKLFESLSQATGFLRPGQGFPSVKRSSVGSISSISSTLSMNPAIEKLRMSDFSDDSNVKLYINKRSAKVVSTSKRSSDSSSTGTITGRRMSDDLHLDANRLSGTSMADKVQSGPLARFAVKIVIHPSDLPDSMAFDPFSHSLVAKSTLADRAQQASRSPSMSSMSVSGEYREKVLFFPRNANVSEILETALDRFGIVEGVVDGGDDVDSKMMKRRSMTRVRYCLASVQPGPYEQETLLNPSSKILDAYSQPPAFKPYEKSSKEFRRRSMETPHNAPSTSDLQSTDPIFIIRRASRMSTPSFNSSLRTREDSNSSLNAPERSASRASESTSVYATPIAEIPPSLERAMSPQQAKQEIIAAQRAASRANQRAMLSAHKNENEGVDVILADKSLIRSSRDGANTRYSYIAADGGSEIDISEIVENEWRSASRQSDYISNSGHSGAARDSTSAMSHVTAESYASALASPLTPAAYLPGYYNPKTGTSQSEADAEERMAIDRVASAPLSYDQPNDYLEQALTTRRSENTTPQGELGYSNSIDQRLERVLSKVRKGAASPGPSGVASALRSRQQQNGGIPDESPSTTGRSSSGADSGRSTPMTATRMGSIGSDRGPSYVSQMMRARSGSTTSNGSVGRASPAPHISERVLSSSARSTPQPEAPPSSGSSTPRRASSKGHAKQPSLASIASDVSSLNSGSPSTPATTSAGNTSSTPVSSTRNESSGSNRLAIPYRDDLGLEFLMQLVEEASGPWRPIRTEFPSVAAVLNGTSSFPSLNPSLASVYDGRRQRLDDLDLRLDQLLSQAMNVN